MSAPVKAPPAWQWPAEVLELADRKNLREYLDPLLEATRRVFAGARWIKVRVEQDPEMRDWQTIVFVVGANGMSAQESSARRTMWIKECINICLPEPIFALFIDSVAE